MPSRSDMTSTQPLHIVTMLCHALPPTNRSQTNCTKEIFMAKNLTRNASAVFVAIIGQQTDNITDLPSSPS